MITTLEAKKIQTFSRLPADGGRAQAEALKELITRAQQLQGD
jgi:hypothetical protein